MERERERGRGGEGERGRERESPARKMIDTAFNDMSFFNSSRIAMVPHVSRSIDCAENGSFHQARTMAGTVGHLLSHYAM